MITNLNNIEQTYSFPRFIFELCEGILEAHPKIRPGRPSSKHQIVPEPIHPMEVDTSYDNNVLSESSFSFDTIIQTSNWKRPSHPTYFNRDPRDEQPQNMVNNNIGVIKSLPFSVSVDASLLWEYSKKCQNLGQSSYALLGGCLDSKHAKSDRYVIQINTLIFGFDPSSKQSEELIELERKEESLLILGLMIGLPNGLDDLNIEHLYTLWQLEVRPPHHCVFLVWSIESKQVAIVELNELARNIFQNCTQESLKESKIIVVNLYNRHVENFQGIGAPVRILNLNPLAEAEKPGIHHSN